MTTKTPPWVHVRQHAIGYGVTAICGVIALVLTLGGQGLLDQRYTVKEVHNGEHRTFTQVYQDTEADKAVNVVRKDLRQMRRELRRAEAYLAADPSSALVDARQASVNELEDEIEDLEEEFELAKKKLGSTP